ncbi:DUF2336 domain-containing protein [Blastochloris sulfoviridis]|uniref:DUF2336 domain-containing protein n=1 Tax=Blastochloris sulfoviridis TaxID=50712 RepID=A0A5M6I6G9_9HYPH|nr:DUF2336 domain-containing protein [Blastochloris sulfoviridis]KAA5603339.1 DUF2336 domain-containing protein [Blastochloris sulfoviridis]
MLISDLEAALASGPGERRLGMLNRVTELFLARAEGVGEAQVAVFDEVLLRLAEGIESRARAELARSLAPVANAPLVLVGNLARDASIVVAAPILQHSERLDDRTLSDYATKLSQGHLLAISRRRRLGTRVTDVLVTRGDRAVVRTVAGNDGARFSDAGFHVLVSRAGDDDLLAETVGLRADLPPASLNRLVRQASEPVRRKLAERDPARGRATATATATIAGRVAPQRNYSAAERLVSALAREGSLDEETVRGFASAGRFEEAVAGLAALSGLTSDVVGQALTSEAGDPALIIGKAAALSWPTVQALLVMRSGGRPIAPRTLEDSRVNYLHLSRETAQRVTRFYRLRAIVNRPAQATPPHNGLPHHTPASRLDA